LDDIMDEVNGGVFSPHAIGAFLSHAYSQWRKSPRYVALVGEGTLDYKDAWGLGNNLLPPLLVGSNWGLYASDNRLADVVGEDGIPEMAIGRIPVETEDQLNVYIDKIMAYEASGEGGWTKEVLWVTDDPDSTGDYPTDGDSLAGWVPGGFRVHRVYLSEMSPQEAFESIVENVNQGVSLMTYLGHAGLTQLAHEGILGSSDVSRLSNQERLPVAILMACHLGNFALPGYPSLAEDLVLHGEGGVAAAWSPVGLSYNPQRVVVAQAFLRVFFENRVDILGDALVEALASVGGDCPAGYREILDTQVLLGDPALDLKGTTSTNR
jgi:hypothetical protein